MTKRYINCPKCPAFHLLNDDRKSLIEKWEAERNTYIRITKQISLILLAESMPASRYFYDVETDYHNKGLRYTLKKEFDKLEIDDSEFLLSMANKGIVLFDCALCPLHKLKDNVSKRKASTHCFLTITNKNIRKYPNTPIVTVFPSKRDWLKSKIPFEIRNLVKGEFAFLDQSGLSHLYNELITKSIENN